MKRLYLLIAVNFSMAVKYHLATNEMNKEYGRINFKFQLLVLILLFNNNIICQGRANLIKNESLERFTNNLFFKSVPKTRYLYELTNLEPKAYNNEDSILFIPVPGPIGGSITSLVLDSTGNLFISTNGGVYKSTNNGLYWYFHLFPSQLYNSVEPVTVLGPNVIAAETDFDNYISFDGAET